MAIAQQSDATAVFGRRVLAFVLDVLIVAVPATMLASAQMEYIDFGSGSRASDFCDAFMDDEAGVCTSFEGIAYFGDETVGQTFGLVGLALGLANLVVLQGLTGFSLGKLITGVRTVRLDGRPCGMAKAFVRWILWLVDGQPCGIPLVGFITGLTTTGHRRVGDMAAKTYVVGAAAAGSPISVPGITAPPPPPGAEAYAAPVGAPSSGWPSETSAHPSPSDSAWPSEPGESPWRSAEPAAPAPPSPGESVPPPPPPGAAPSAPVAPPAGTTEPQWDEARGTYIQWDPAQGAWFQWDDAAKVWSRIPGQ